MPRGSRRTATAGPAGPSWFRGVAPAPPPATRPPPAYSAAEEAPAYSASPDSPTEDGDGLGAPAVWDILKKGAGKGVDGMLNFFGSSEGDHDESNGKEKRGVALRGQAVTPPVKDLAKSRWNLGAFLRELGLSRHNRCFEQHKVTTMEAALALTEELLRTQMEVEPLGDRLRIVSKLNEMDREMSVASIRTVASAGLPDDDQGDFPSHFMCPITFDVMTDPVVAIDGHTYERAAVEHWLRSNDRSPKTNETLTSKIVVPNHVMRAQIIEHMEQRGFHRE